MYYCGGIELISHPSTLLTRQFLAFRFQSKTHSKDFHKPSSSLRTSGKLSSIFMYDILQLNDMLVPELLDIAEQLKISGAKKLDKQELIYKILDKQAVVASEGKADAADDKPKRKRIIKTSTANSTEEAIVESVEEKPKKAEAKKENRKKEEKPILKKAAGRKKEEEPEEEVVAAPVAKAA